MQKISQKVNFVEVVENKPCLKTIKFFNTLIVNVYYIQKRFPKKVLRKR